LATNAHFSSNWTSRVLGGKRDEFVVDLPRVLAGQPAVAPHGVAIHLAKPPSLADAAALGDVFQDRFDLLGGQLGPEQGSPLALGEAGQAGAAPEHAARLVGAVAAGHGQISRVPLALIGASGIQAAEAPEVIHGAASKRESPRGRATSVLPKRYTRRSPLCNGVRPRGIPERQIPISESRNQPY
jgi:hypothetical protein